MKHLKEGESTPGNGVFKVGTAYLFRLWRFRFKWRYSTIRKRTFVHFGFFPPIKICRAIEENFDEAAVKEYNKYFHFTWNWSF